MNVTIELPADLRFPTIPFTEPLALEGDEMTQNSTKMIATNPSIFLRSTVYHHPGSRGLAGPCGNYFYRMEWVAVKPTGSYRPIECVRLVQSGE